MPITGARAGGRMVGLAEDYSPFLLLALPRLEFGPERIDV